MSRPILLGRKTAVWPALHWAVKVGEVWYEIEGKGAIGDPETNNTVARNTGFAATSGTGLDGGNLVGETYKTDSEIEVFISFWLNEYPLYNVFSTNCQCFAYEFVYFLTNGVNFRLPYRLDASVLKSVLVWQTNFCYVVESGVRLARLVMGGEARGSVGHFHALYRAPYAETVTIRRGISLGGWCNLSPLGRAELNVGTLVGVHVEPNVNTGIGLRDGNVDVHLIGYGVRVGADGVEINTPVGGVSACTIM